MSKRRSSGKDKTTRIQKTRMMRKSLMLNAKKIESNALFTAVIRIEKCRRLVMKNAKGYTRYLYN
jgi:hypothetical protein